MDMTDMNGTPMNGTPMNGSSVNGAAHDDEAQLRAEYQRLQTELANAKARVVQAQQRIAARDAEIQTALRDELRLAQDELADLAVRHEDELASIRREAEAEVARLLASDTENLQVHHDQ
jgi:hypothetical protein